MPYKYVAYTQAGERVQGTLNVPSEAAAEEALWRSNYVIISLRQARSGADLAALMPTFFGVKTRDLIVFSRQLATLIESGITILSGLQMLGEEASSKPLQKALQEVSEDVQEGETLSNSLRKQPQTFPFIYSRMIEIGERMGNMESVLRQVATYMEKRESLTRKLRGAMAYPAFIISLLLVVVFLMITFTLPGIMGLFGEFEIELPTPTKILMAITDFSSTYQSQMVAGAVLVVTVIALYLRTSIGQRHRDILLLKIPLIGAINIQSSVAQLCHTMSILLKAGLPMSEIMNLIVDTMGNIILKEAFSRVRTEMLQGQGLSQPIRQEKVFPGLLAQMVRVGEETGTLDTNLETLAVFYEEEADRKINALTSMMEPALMLFVGVMVGFLAVAVITPMYSLMGGMK
ncbi:MAG: type II secretion system F family protein [Anaerolineales bacterium]|nr:type II secretion system F family protein [Anaerolineales bacterium]